MDCFLLPFLGILAILQIRGDGYFPFPKSWPQPLLSGIVLVHTVVLAALIVRCAYGLVAEYQPKPLAIPPRVHRLMVGVVPIAALGAISGLHLLQARYYRFAGYRMDVSVLTRYLLVSMVPLGIYWVFAAVKRRVLPQAFLLSIAASAFLMKGLPLALFPITAHRSDMLPILKEGALSLFHGDNPYQYYLLDNGARTQNVRLPGLMMAYLPAAVLGVDLRWVTLAFELAIVLMVLFHFRNAVDGAAFKQGEVPWAILWAMTGFLLFPYWHYRHELYETPFWFLLLVTLFALARGRGWGFMLGVGAMVGTHQWGWLFAPFLLLSWCRLKGWKAAVWSGLVAIGVGVLILAIGVRSHIREFYEHVFGFYIKRFKINELYPMSLYFAPWFIKWNLTRWLFPIQCLLQVPLLALAYRHGRRMSALAGLLALSLATQLLFNSVAWTYQYLLVVFLLILGLCFRVYHESYSVGRDVRE